MFIKPCFIPIIRLILSACLFAGAGYAHAAMQLDRTRLVIEEANGSAHIQVRSEDPHPLLLQAWITPDAPDMSDMSDTSNPPAPARSGILPATPFLIDPPVLRLDPGQTQALRLWLVNPTAQLPADRESLYWLNVLEVPAMTPAPRAGASRLTMSLQSQLKVFYRPRALAGTSSAALLEPAERLRFAVERDAEARLWLTIANPAPLYQNLAALSVQTGADKGEPLALAAPTVAPFARVKIALPPDYAAAHVHFALIGDNGQLSEDEAVLSIPARSSRS